MKQNNKLLHYIENYLEGVAMGAAGGNKMFVSNVVNLNTLVETTVGTDGKRALVSKMTWFCRFYSSKNFLFIPLIVQTAGTVSDTVDLDFNTIRQSLDSAISDVYGYQTLGNFRFPKRVPADDYTSSSPEHFGTELTLELPQNIRQLLNKETETERLQDLYFVIVGLATGNSQQIDLNTAVEIQFVESRRAIVIR